MAAIMLFEESLQVLQQGIRALQQQNYPEAIAHLENFCNHFPDNQSPYFIQAQMSLLRAYRGQGEQEKAIALCQCLLYNPDREVAEWARSLFKILTIDEKNNDEFIANNSSFKNGPRADQTDIKIVMPKIADSLKFAMAITLIFPFLVGFIIIFLILFPWLNSVLFWNIFYALLGTILINCLFFFLSSWLIDYTQDNFYKTRWANLSDLQLYSPEAGEIILNLARKHRLKLPRFGIINDSRPIVFTYGFSSNQARLVVSQGLLDSLQKDEIAIIYAQEFGHILNQDFWVMTLVSGWGQFFYLLYLFCQKLGQKGKILHAIAILLSLPCYGLFQLNCFFNAYLSRTRKYYADHFAVKLTGNPNALIRTLLKMPSIQIQQEFQATQSAPFLLGMQNFSSCSPCTSAIAEKTSNPNFQSLGKILLWDLLNPWATLLELVSAYPLIGKRIQVLTYYAEQLNLNCELNISQIRKEAKSINRNLLYLIFFLELGLISLPILGLIGGFIAAKNEQLVSAFFLLKFLLLGFGLGLLLQIFITYFTSWKPIESSIQTLFYDIYTSPFQSRSVVLQGQLKIANYANFWGKSLYFHDQKAIIRVEQNLFSQSWQKLFKHRSSSIVILENAMQVTGVYYRHLSPYLDLKRIDNDEIIINNYPQLGKFILAIAALILGFIINK